MEIRERRVYRGPNIWTGGPVISLLLDPGDSIELSAPEIERRTRIALPAYPGRANDPTSDADAAIVSRIVVGLQNMTGAQLSFIDTRPARAPGLVRVLYAYQFEEVGLAARAARYTTDAEPVVASLPS